MRLAPIKVALTLLAKFSSAVRDVGRVSRCAASRKKTCRTRGFLLNALLCLAAGREARASRSRDVLYTSRSANRTR